MEQTTITVNFVSIDMEARTATFDVDGVIEERQIADGVGQDTIAEHLTAMAEGLVIEAKERLVPEITEAPFAVGQEIITEQVVL
jgi:hypothetical protein